MIELETVQENAWEVLTSRSRSPRVILQIGYLIDFASTVKDVLLALSMLGDFETEEASATEEAVLNARWEM